MIFAGVHGAPIFDALRYFDLALGLVLALGLAGFFLREYHRRPTRHVVLGSLFGAFLINAGTLLTDITRLGEPGDARLPLRLGGHLVCVTVIVVAVTMLKRGEDPFE